MQPHALLREWAGPLSDNPDRYLHAQTVFLGMQLCSCVVSHVDGSTRLFAEAACFLFSAAVNATRECRALSCQASTSTSSSAQTRTTINHEYVTLSGSWVQQCLNAFLKLHQIVETPFLDDYASCLDTLTHITTMSIKTTVVIKDKMMSLKRKQTKKQTLRPYQYYATPLLNVK